MSDDKKSGLGLFINQKKASASPATSAVKGGGKQKDVKKRWMYAGIGAMAVVVVATAAFSDKAPEARQAKKDDNMVSVTPPNADKAAFEAQFGKDLEQLKGQFANQQAENEGLKKQLDDLRAQGKLQAQNKPAAALPDNVVPPPSDSGNTGGLGSLNTRTSAPPPPPIPPRLSTAGAANLSGAGALSGSNLPPVAPSVGASPMVFDIKGVSTDTSNGMAASGLPSVNAKVSYKKNESAGMLPAGGFAPVVLLNGLDAGTSSATQANPMPVLMNVTDQATMPGAARYKLKSCFVLGNGFGDLSAERVYVRFNRLSCVDKNDHLILSQEVAGYVVDSDGKLGLRGKVVDRQGARLGKALLAGFAQGLSGALGNAQSSVTSNFSSGLTSSSISGSAALRQSGLSGAQSASQQLAEFYLKEAESIFPVVSIDTGRTGTIVFTNSVSLQWQTGDSQFVQQVQPN
jgi:conjugal transfer pilus assembly protein TraB